MSQTMAQTQSPGIQPSAHTCCSIPPSSRPSCQCTLLTYQQLARCRGRRCTRSAAECERGPCAREDEVVLLEGVEEGVAAVAVMVPQSGCSVSLGFEEAQAEEVQGWSRTRERSRQALAPYQRDLCQLTSTMHASAFGIWHAACVCACVCCVCSDENRAHLHNMQVPCFSSGKNTNISHAWLRRHAVWQSSNGWVAHTPVPRVSSQPWPTREWPTQTLLPLINGGVGAQYKAIPQSSQASLLV